jgi:excisionase family DNA binding protein
MDGMTTGQAARALGVPRGRIDYLIRTGRLQCVRFGPLRIITSLAIAPARPKISPPGRPRKIRQDP